MSKLFMETYRTTLFLILAGIGFVLYTKWIEFSTPLGSVDTTLHQTTNQTGITDRNNSPDQTDATIPTIPNVDATLPNAPQAAASTVPAIVSQQSSDASQPAITVETDLVIAHINPVGGVIERVELKAHPVTIDQPNLGFPLIKKSAEESFIVQDGLMFVGETDNPNHAGVFQAAQQTYSLGDAEQLNVPLSWVNANGVTVTKTFVFNRNSYVVTVDYQIDNQSAETLNAIHYGQFNRTEPVSRGGGFGQLPSFVGGAIYTEQDKYQKIDFDELADGAVDRTESGGWVAMMQHYFAAVWLLDDTQHKLYSKKAGDKYILGFQNTELATVASGNQGNLSADVFIGPKEQERLREIEEQRNIEGLPLTVDYGWLTFIADPLFTILNFINKFINNWGFSIIVLTFLIKLAFYWLSAKSYKSMAGMKKLQPRIQTLKERYKDDRQKFQMEMMQLYKTEKVNPAGGCLPILVQIPVFIALYWVLLESVEIRQAPFALWWQDLSAPDPYFVLPVLMGLSMWVQQKLNPAPMDDIQKKVFAIMPFMLTLLFLTFPAGLVLYWVVNNVLSMAQQWFINKRHAV